MSPLMNRLAELLGPDLAHRLAAEFGGQTIYFPAFYRPASEQERLSARDAGILAEFDGANHIELAHKHHISLQWVYRLVQQAQRATLVEALRASGESSPAEVVWVSPLPSLGRPGALAAALRAIETATAQGRFDQLAVALAFLPPETEAAHRAAGRPAPVAPAEIQPGTPAPAGNAPHPQSEQPSHSN